MSETENRTPELSVEAARESRVAGRLKRWRGNNHLLMTAIVIVFFAMVALLFTRPLITQGGTATVKHVSDPQFQAWTLAWDLHAIKTSPLDLFNANILYPNKYTLAYSDHQITNALLAAPVIGVTGNVMQATNYVLIFQFFLCALGAYCLAIRLTGSRMGGIVAGIAYSYAPYKLSHIVHLNLCSAAWIPFAFLFLHRYCEEKKVRDALLFALFFVLQVLTTWHYGIILSIGVIIFLLVRLIMRRKTYTLRWTLTLAAVFVLAGLVILPFALPYLRLQNQDPRFKRGIKEVETFTADAQDFLAAPKENLIWGGLTDGFRNRILKRGERNGPTERSLFPGLLPFILGIAGIAYLFRKGRDEERFSLWTYLVILVVSFILCLGYPLFIFGHKIKIPTLYQLLYYVFPGFKAMRVPPRFTILIALSLAVFSAFAMRGLLNWLGEKRGVKIAGVAALVVLALLLVDLMPTAIPMQKILKGKDFPPVYSWLAKQPGEAPTVELPIPLLANADRWAYLDSMRDYFSTGHWKKIMNGYSGFLPDSLYGAAYASQDFPSDSSARFFKKERVRYVIVHGKELDPATMARVLAWQKGHPDFVPVATFGSDYVYRIDAR